MQGRVNGGKAWHGPPRRSVRRAIVVPQQLVTPEDGAFDDREVVAVLRDLPHLFETRQRPGVIVLKRIDRTERPHLSVERKRVAHRVDRERVVFDHAREM